MESVNFIVTLKVRILSGCSSRFLSYTNHTRSHKACEYRTKRFIPELKIIYKFQTELKIISKIWNSSLLPGWKFSIWAPKWRINRKYGSIIIYH